MPRPKLWCIVGAEMEENGRTILTTASGASLVAQIEADSKIPVSWLQLFREPNLRKRAICTLLVWTMGMNTGIIVISNLTPTLFAGLGYGSVLQLSLGLVFCVVLLIGCFCGMVSLDRIGRRPLLGKLWSSSLVSR